MEKKVLIVVDMQNDFISGSLGSVQAQAIVPRVQEKIEAYLSRGDQVIFTRDTHDDTYLQTEEGKHLPVQHCQKGTSGWEIPKELDRNFCLHIDKPNFGWQHWQKQNLEDAEMELVGLCTDICVVSNALLLKTFYPENPITVDASCCAGVTPESHRAALETMKMCQIQIINME